MYKMNQLLVMPRFVDKVGKWYHFPLGLPYVSASLKKSGFNIFTINLNNEEGSVEEVLRREISEHNIQIVETGGLSFQYSAIKDIVDIVKHINPKIVTVVGGGIITGSPETAMEALEHADYGVIGEGEITNSELSRAIEENEDVSKVAGIIYYKDGEYIRTPQRKEIEDLDLIPYPDYEGFGFEKIMDSIPSLLGMNEKNTITMLTSRSCPYKCTFCFHTSGNTYRKRSLDNFFSELEMLISKYGIKYIFISDELFSYDKERMYEFCKRIKKYNIKWWAQFRVTDVTPELVKLLKESNCATMGFGIESADNRILRSMQKGITIEQTTKALEIVYNSGITIQGGLIFGDVAETVETATNTLNWWKEHLHYGLTLNFITTYPGTGLYKYAVKEKIITDEVEFIQKACPTINVSHMTSEERAWLAEQIVTLPQMQLREPKHIRDVNINYNEGAISSKGECVECNQTNEWNDIRMFTRNVLTCNKCGRKYIKFLLLMKL